MKHKRKTKKLRKQKRINQKGKGTIDGIRVTPKPEDFLQIPYIKKCPDEFTMCDQDEVNYGLCVPKDNIELCKDPNYEFKYLPPDEHDKNAIKPVNRLTSEVNGKGLIQDPLKPVKVFEINYEGEYNSEDPNNPYNLLSEDVLMNEYTGRLKSYAPEYHPTSCAVQQKKEATIETTYKAGDTYKRRIDSQEVTLAFTPVPSPFKILTQNALGIYRGEYGEPLQPGSANEATFDLMVLRTALFREFLKTSYPDFVCIQESTRTYIDLLDKQDIPHLYPYIYPTEEEMVRQERLGANATTTMLSKYPAKKATTYMLQGNSSYYNALGVYEFDNLVIFNVYMQAGSAISPGQKYKWENYARCRRQQLMFIKNEIDKIRSSSGFSKPIVVLGDFNFELNSIKYEGENTDTASRNNSYLIYDPSASDMTWSEHKFLVGPNGLNLYDSYKELNIDSPDKTIKEGLTENTNLNTFRFLGKLEKKALRYDGIFFNDNLKPLKSDVVNNEPIIIDSDPDTIQLFNSNGVPDYAANVEKYNTEYAEHMIFNPKGNAEAIKKKNDFLLEYKTKKGNLLSVENGFELFVSDHFGVMTEFEIKSQTGGTKVRRKSRRKYKFRRRKTVRYR